MCTTRRDFLNTAALSGLGLVVSPLLKGEPVRASDPSLRVPRGATGERIAGATASLYRPYRSRSSLSPGATTWAQIDLGSSQPIEAIKLYPSNEVLPLSQPGEGFPSRFRIECSDDPAWSTQSLIADCSKTDYPDPGNQIVQFDGEQKTARYLRIVATRLRAEKPALPIWTTLQTQTSYSFALAKIEVISAGMDIAVNRPVTVDAALGNMSDAQQLTRPPRPQGEGLLTDNPHNVSAPETWQTIVYRAKSPLGGIQVKDGLFRTSLQRNMAYLLDSYSVDDLLHPFRERMGKPVPGPPRASWDQGLPGSNAGRFLMGAANTLHWIDNDELRNRMNAVVAGIAECRQPNGYIMAYPESTFFDSEHGAFTRAWLTHGLIYAGDAGNAKAFELLRGYYDGYNQMPALPQALRRCGYGGQGMVANTRMYFTPVGRAADVQVIQRYFQENYWLEDLAARRADALWQYPYDRPHGYLITFLEAYLDLYRATGEPRYLEAVEGGWELIHEHWQNVGGSISLIEYTPCPPDSNSLQAHLGETCCSAFWILLNQRLHELDPEEEKYITEIEKSIYNILLANQDGSQGIRYHSMLVGQKSESTRVSTCCEGQGTRILASLPHYIYSLDAEGLYINLFEPSVITWTHSSVEIKLEMETKFPYGSHVLLNVHASSPVQAKLRIRVPSWAAGAMNIQVNQVQTATGSPGGYVTLDRQWSAQDKITFTLPMSFKLTKYTGADQTQGRERFALEYGPILMAALSAADGKIELRHAQSPEELISRLRPVEGVPLRFKVMDPLAAADMQSETEFIPYFQIGAESFSCFPVIDPMNRFF